MDIIEHTLRNRYYQPNETCWDDIAKRVGNYIGKTEDEKTEFYKIISEKKFIPNSPTLMNAGTTLSNFSACFVIPVPDNMEGIGNAVTNLMLISKSGGGVGYSFEELRPKNSSVASTNGVASGPVSFIGLFDAATDVVKQAGKRRGANMGVLPVWHPDIFEFVNAKTEEGKLSNFNLSVALTDDFMKAVENNDDWNLQFDGCVLQVIKARDLFNNIIENMWQSGEPGVIFIDTINKDNKYDEPIKATNPCVTGDTEILTKKGYFLIKDLIYQDITIWDGYEWSDVQPYYTGKYEIYEITFEDDTSIKTNAHHLWRLSYHDTNERVSTSDLCYNTLLWKGYGTTLCGWNDPTGKKYNCGLKIKSVIKTNTIEKTYCLTEPKRHMFVANGVLTGNCGEQPLIANSACNLGSIDVSKLVGEWGYFDWSKFDNLIKMGVYFLNRTIDLNHSPLKEINETVKKYRPIGLGIMGFADLLIKLNCKYGSEASYDIADDIASFLYNRAENYAKQFAEENNTQLNTTFVSYAPTGSISLFAGCSSGIEPNFAFEYNRKTWVDGKENTFKQYHPLYEKCDKQNIPDYFITAMEISPEDHIKMQAIFQKYCDSGISKTINIPNNATKDNIDDLIFMAWKLGCKGFTMYRDGSRAIQVLSIEHETEDEKKRPTVLPGSTYKKQSGCGKLFITVTERNGKPYEVFVQTAGIGGCQANSEALGRTISIGLRNGIEPSEYIRQLSRVICPKCKGRKDVDGKSCADIVGKCLTLGTSDMGLSERDRDVPNLITKHDTTLKLLTDNKCPECGEKLMASEGCVVCLSCGFSRC